MGRYFQSERVLEVNLFVQLVNLNDRWMRKPAAVLRGNAHRIQQLMNLRYNLDEVNE